MIDNHATWCNRAVNYSLRIQLYSFFSLKVRSENGNVLILSNNSCLLEEMTTFMRNIDYTGLLMMFLAHFLNTLYCWNCHFFFMSPGQGSCSNRKKIPIEQPRRSMEFLLYLLLRAEEYMHLLLITFCDLELYFLRNSEAWRKTWNDGRKHGRNMEWGPTIVSSQFLCRVQ